MQIARALLLFTCLLTAYADNGDGILPEDIFRNLNVSMQQIYPALVSACLILGCFMIVKAIFMLKKLGHKTAFMGSSGNMIGPLALIIIGVALINAPTFIRTVIITLYANNIQNSFSWSQAHSGGGTWYATLTPMIGLIQVIGIFAFLRGGIILSKACNENAQPGNISKGLLHIVGGIMAINITGTIDLINNTLGFN